jgi:tetratricopeptide (TPR) repeat protein
MSDREESEMARDAKHPGRETLRRFVCVELPGSATKAVVRHLLRGCERCQQQLTAVAFGLYQPGLAEARGSGGQYSRPITTALRRAKAAVEVRQVSSTGGTKPDVKETLKMYYRRLADSRRLRQTDHEEMLFAAMGALLYATQLRPEDFLPGVACDLRARAWAELGNAHRITESFGRAEECFKEAMLYLGRGSGQPELRAEVLDFHASLDRAQRRFKQAFRRLDEVYAIYVQLGDFHLAGKARVNKGIAALAANEVEAAIPLIRSGLNWLEQDRDPGLYVTAVHNLAWALVEAQLFAEGRAFIEEHQDLFIKHAGPLLILRLRWNEAKIAAGLGEASTAEPIFQQVRQAFADRKLAFVSALVSLDLAALFLEQGRTGEVAALATEMVATFSRLRIRREAIAAVLLFERAALQERVTLALLRHVASRLHELEHGPQV